MNTIKFLKSAPISADNFCSDLVSLRTDLFSKGVCWTDDVQGKFEPSKPFRVILYPRNGSADFKNPMLKECNGLVVEYNNEWKVLAMPLGAFCTNKISFKKLADLHGSDMYDVYEVLDATMITLYFYKGEWRIASSKGYDIGSTNMIKGMTFMEAVHDLMETKYKSFKFEDLNKECSYTIALRHSKYHIFDETKHLANRTKHVPRPGVDMNSYLIVMSVVNTLTGSRMSKHVPGLPYQSPLTMKENNIHTLTKYASSAYAKYAKAYRLDNFKYKPLYGYILRAKYKSVPSEYSTIYIESELYRVIKAGLYKDNRAIRNMDYDKLVIQMSMNHDRYEQYRILFQQFDSKFADLDAAIESVAAEVIQRIVASEEAKSTSEEEDPIQQLLAELTEQFKNEPDVSTGVIKDAIYSKKHAERLFALL